MYRATKNENGTFSIFDVPIFGELAKGVRGNEDAVDRAWMEAAIAQARMREKEGYKYRLHILHHDPSNQPQPAGSFRLTRVRPITYEGRKMDALHADFLNVPEWVFQQIQRGELLYRSVEINNIKGTPEIDSVALLTTETPFFRLPVTDGETVKLENETEGALVGAVAFQVNGDARRVLFRAQETQEMAKLTLRLNDEGELVAVNDSGKEFRAARDGDPRQGEFTLHTPEGDFEAFMDKPEKDDDDDKESMSSLKAKLKKLMDENEKLKKKLMDKGEGKKDEDKMKNHAPTEDAVKMQARIDALEANAADRDAKDRTETRFKAAVAELDGWHVPDHCAENMRKFAALDDESVLDSYVAEFKATRAKDPVPLDDLLSGSTTEPDEVAKFKAQGPEAYEKAQALSVKFDALNAAGFFTASKMTREQFIELRMENKE